MKNIIHITGHRWKDTYGNTYHTATIIMNGKHVFKSPITYGYDRQYFYTAKKWLEDNGYTLPDDFTESVYDVKRKKDL